MPRGWHEDGEGTHELRGWRQALEARMSKGMNSPLEPPEGTQARQHLDFDPIALTGELISSPLMTVPCF